MKKKYLSLIAISLLFVSNLFGQITFQKSFTLSPSEKSEVYTTNDGGYAIVGRKIIRLNNLGDTLWTKSYIFGSGALNAAVQTLDGGYAISGFTNSAGIGLRDFFLIKTDSLGNVMWSKAYGGLNHDDAYGLYQTTDSGFIISGSSRSVFPGSVCYYLVRTDVNGNLIWTKAIDGNDIATTVIQTIDGGFIVSGRKTYKMDSSGNIQWAKQFQGQGSQQIKSIRQTTDGGYILTGTAYNFDTTNIVVALLFKIDSTGVFQWSKYFANGFTFGNAAEQTNDGGYIIAIQQGGPSGNDVSLIKTNSAGDTIWTKAYGSSNNDIPWSVKQTSDGGYIIAATSDGFGYGIYVIKTDSLGNSGCNQLPSTITVFDSLVIESAVADSAMSGGTAVPFSVSSTIGTTAIPLCFANSTDTQESDANDPFCIYPNPSFGNFTITAKNTIKQGFVKIYNLFGTTVYEGEILNSHSTEIHLKNIAEGIYFIKITDGKKCRTNMQIIMH